MSRHTRFRHKRFCDGAGYTRHCWECANATNWDGANAWCAANDMDVNKYDSPNNTCSKARTCNSYREIGDSHAS